METDFFFHFCSNNGNGDTPYMPFILFRNIEFFATTYFIRAAISAIASLSGEKEESFYKIIKSTYINLYWFFLFRFHSPLIVWTDTGTRGIKVSPKCGSSKCKHFQTVGKFFRGKVLNYVP